MVEAGGRRGGVSCQSGCVLSSQVCKGQGEAGGQDGGRQGSVMENRHLSLSGDNRGTAVKTPSSETIGTGVCAPGQGTQPPWLSFLR